MRASPHRVSRIVTGLLAAIITLAGMLMLPNLARAEDPVDFSQAELDLLHSENARGTFVINVDESGLTKDEIIAHYLDYYAQFGYSEEWIRGAETYTLQVQAGVLWTWCSLTNTGAGTGGECTPVDVQGGSNSFATLQVLGHPGTNDWIALMCGNFRVYSIDLLTYDLAKADFRVDGIPTAMTVNQPVTATVHATISASADSELASINFNDSIKVEVPTDCTATPSAFTIEDTLAPGESKTYARDTSITCSHHSNHTFTFVDRLVGPTGYRDTLPDNNTRTVPVSTTVWEDYDLSVDNVALDCAATTNIGEAFTCTGGASLTNATANSDVPFSASLSISPHADCTIQSATAVPVVDAYIPAGQSVHLNGSWTVTCAKRSDHPTTLTATASEGNHLRDSNPSNNTVTVTDNTEVFQAAVLGATVTNLLCSEREANPTASDCVATVQIANNGSGSMANDIKTLTTVDFDVADDCTATLTSAQPIARTLSFDASGALVKTVTASVSIACTLTERHSVTATATVTNDPANDPHAPATAADSAVWVPIDVKPTSLPSSFNLNGGGSVPFAILGTADFDPTTDLVPGTVRMGVYGSEVAVTACQYAGEDRNGDGRLDLVCHVSKSALVSSGVKTTTTWLSIRGVLTDGTDLFGQDDVSIQG